IRASRAAVRLRRGAQRAPRWRSAVATRRSSRLAIRAPRRSRCGPELRCETLLEKRQAKDGRLLRAPRAPLLSSARAEPGPERARSHPEPKGQAMREWVVLAVEAQVAAVVLQPGEGGRLVHAAPEVVHDLGRGRVRHAPPRAAGAQAQVDVFFVEEEGLV